VVEVAQAAVPAIDAAVSAAESAVEWVDAVVDGNVTELAGNKAVDGAKDAIAPGALEEQKRILEDAEKTANQSVDPFSKWIQKIGQACSNALTGSESESTGDKKSSKSESSSSDPDDPGKMRPLTKEQINRSRMRAAQMPDY
jgi:hypothetical protein